MLQNIRENAQGTIAKIIIGLMVISFAFFGVESLIGGGTNTVATVNGEDILPGELDNAMNQERNRRMSAMGENLDAALIEPEVLRAAALEQLIQQKLLLQAAAKASVEVSPASIDQTIVNMQQFQENGRFSQQQFQNILRGSGYTPAYFKMMLHNDLVIGQLSNGVTASEFVTPEELNRIAQLVGQKRSFHFLTIPANQVGTDVKVDDAAVKAYYDANAEEFKTPEQVKVDYIDVRQDDFFKPVSEDELQIAYQEEAEAFESGEERRASHILIPIDGEQDEASALEKALSLRAKLEAGADFAELATAESADIGSAGNGGDLGYTSGDTFPPDFEEALFNLSPNQVSEPVLTDAGFHLIKLTDVKTTEMPSFDEMKPVLEQRIKVSRSETDFVAAVEELRDLVFNSDGLQEPAEELGLQVKQSDWFSREGGKGSLADPRVAKAAFSEEVLVEGHNSRVIELAADHFIVVAVAKHQPPALQDFAKVAESIRDKLLQREKQDRINRLAASVVERLQGGESREDLATELDQQWVEKQSLARTAVDVNREVLQAVFTLPSPSGNERPVVEAVNLTSGDVAVVVLDSVENGNLSDYRDNEVAALRGEMQRALRSLSTMGFLKTLRDGADVEVF